MNVVAGGMAEYTNFEGNSVNILGLKQSLQFDEFPSQPMDVSLFLLLVPSPSEYGEEKQMGIEFGLLDQTPILTAGPSAVQFLGPNEGNSVPMVHLHLRLSNWRFQEPGMYALRFFYGDKRTTAFETTIGVSQRIQEASD